MKLHKTPLAAAALALLSGSLPAGAQTGPVTVQAESMTRSNYVVEGGTRIKLSAASGSASTVFGAEGTYDVQVHVITESDGQPTLEVYRDGTKLHSFVYPRVSGNTSFTVRGVALKKGETIRLQGRANGDAWARVDRIVFTPAAVAGPTAKTIEAESMTRASYAIENSNRIKLTAATGTASAPFGGGAGNYKLQVYVQPETDGRPQLEVYRNGDKVRTFTYPLASTATTLTIDSVALTPSDTIKLVGHANGDAWARVDKIVFTPTTLAPVPLEGGGSVPGGSTPPPDTSACANPAGGYHGFGRNTTGGAGKPIYRVTTLNDSGSGSLRDAVSQGNRCVVFDVGGTISLASNLTVRGANVTIDGLTAPSPGITLRDKTLVIQGSAGAGNVVARGIRHRGVPPGEDAIRVYGAQNIVLDRLSVAGFGDGGIDITEFSSDVTLQWSILGNGNPDHNFPSLIGYDASRITVHHNLYVNGANRNPYCGRNSAGSVQNGWSGTTLAPEIVCDVRNNVVWNYMTHGTAVRAYSKANVVNNYYYTTDAPSEPRGVYITEGAVAHTSGNFSRNGSDLNKGQQSAPFATVATPPTSDALTAAKEVLSKAGARGSKFGLDATDQAYIKSISLE